MENHKHLIEMREFVDKRETQNVEFKESLKLKEEIGKTVSAFSNSDGGVVLVGVFDDGRILGVDIGNNTLEELANYIKRNTDPQIFPSVKVQEVGEKNVVKLSVTEKCRKTSLLQKSCLQKGWKRES